jgi:WD repeat-containing protein 61
MDSKLRIYTVDESSDPTVIDIEAMQLWNFDFHPQSNKILYGTISLHYIDLNISDESKEIRSFGKFVNWIKYSNMGNLFACGDIDGVLAIYSSADQGSELVKNYEDHGLPIRDLSFSNEDQFIVSVSDDFHINLTDVNTQKRIQSFTGHQQEILWWDFHPSGKYFVTGSADKTIKVWDLNLRKCVNTLKVHGDNVWSLKFSKDGKLLFSGSEEGMLAVSEFK